MTTAPSLDPVVPSGRRRRRTGWARLQRLGIGFGAVFLAFSLGLGAGMLHGRHGTPFISRTPSPSASPGR